MSNTNLDDVLNPTPVDTTEEEDVVDASAAEATEVTESTVTEPETDVDTSNVAEPSADATESNTVGANDTDNSTETSDDATKLTSDDTDSTNSESESAVSETCSTWELKQPTPIYRGANKNTGFANISGVVEVKGEPVNGFVAVSCGIKGVGKVDGYIESAYVGW